MSTIETEPEQLAPPESLRDAAELREQLFAEARELLEKGNPWKALPKKAEALGLKPIDGFNSMRAQDSYKRPDLDALGSPLSSSRLANEQFFLTAAAKLFPSEEGAESMVRGLGEAARQPRNEGTETAIAQARQALDEISVESRKLQYQRAFDEVGTYGRHAGWVAARAGNGDLLVAQETPKAMEALASAGYRETQGGYESSEGPRVPFNNTPESTKDVKWAPATGTEPTVG
jgi:hypothetical protein